MTENEEEDLIRLSQIFKTLKEDAFEVTDLVVKGINSYKMNAYLAIAFGILSLWNLNNYVGSNNQPMMIFCAIIAVLSFVAAPYSYYKNRQLKKKYQELIKIHENLMED